MTIAAPEQIIRSAAGTGEAFLVTSITSRYAWVWSDSGSGANDDVSLYTPVPEDSGWMIVGDYAQGNYSEPSGSSLLVRAINDDPLNPLIKQPVTYTQVWTDKSSGGRHDGSLWYPVPPDGYVSLGFVAVPGYSMPVRNNYACIRRDYTETSAAGQLIWADHGSGAKQDVSLYQLEGVAGAFVAQANYAPYTGPASKLLVR